MMTKIKHKELLVEFIDLLNEGRYYDAHEALEYIWFPRRFENDTEMLLLKGFINAAVSFELIKRGRAQQSKKVWRNYLKYRQLLFKVTSEFKNDYIFISRHIEKLHRQKLTNFSHK